MMSNSDSDRSSSNSSTGRSALHLRKKRLRDKLSHHSRSRSRSYSGSSRRRHGERRKSMDRVGRSNSRSRSRHHSSREQERSRSRSRSSYRRRKRSSSRQRRHRYRSRSRSVSSNESDRNRNNERVELKHADPFCRMSGTEYEHQINALNAAEVANDRELLEGVDITSKSSIENATAHRIAREIKKCVHEEVQRYIKTDEYKSMVENLKRRERERLLQDITLDVAKERDAILAVEREKMKKKIAEQMSSEDILADNQRKIEEQQRKEFEKRRLTDEARLEEIQRRKQLEEQLEVKRAKEAEMKRKASEESQKLILNRNEKLSFGLKKNPFY